MRCFNQPDVSPCICEVKYHKNFPHISELQHAEGEDPAAGGPPVVGGRGLVLLRGAAQVAPLPGAAVPHARLPAPDDDAVGRENRAAGRHPGAVAGVGGYRRLGM